MGSDLAPIVLFVYNRPEHTLRVLQALSQNELADQSALYVFSDGPKADPADRELVMEVRNVIQSRDWVSRVELVERPTNIGLADSIVSGVTEVIDRHGKVIVLEDDIVTSKGFLKFMNDALSQFQQESRIMHVTGHSFPLKLKAYQHDFYLLRYISPWGWATWKDRWDHFNNNAAYLLDQLHAREDFDQEVYNSGYGTKFYEQLVSNVDGTLKTWAVKWHTLLYLQNKLALFPKQSMVLNIGFDGSGTNCPPMEAIEKELTHSMINLDLRNFDYDIDEEVLGAFTAYYHGIARTNQFERIKQLIYGGFQSIFVGREK